MSRLGKRQPRSVQVQEPENTLLAAPTKPKEEGVVFIVSKISKQITVNGTKQNFSQPADGIIGFMLVFDDYEKALKWVDGDASLVRAGQRL